MPIYSRGVTPLTSRYYQSKHIDGSDDIPTHDLKHKRTTSGFTQACDKIKETVEHYRNKEKAQ